MIADFLIGLSHQDDFVLLFSGYTLSQEMFPNSCRYLAVGHLVRGFNGEDVRFESFVPNKFFQLAFCLTRAKYLEGV